MKKVLNSLLNKKVAKMPVGNAVGLAAGIGLTGGLQEAISQYLPAEWQRYSSIPLGLGLAYIFENVGFFRKYLGEALVDALAIGSIYYGLERTLFVSGRINSLVYSAIPQPKLAAPTATAAAPEVETAARPSASSVDEKIMATLGVS